MRRKRISGGSNFGPRKGPLKVGIVPLRKGHRVVLFHWLMWIVGAKGEWSEIRARLTSSLMKWIVRGVIYSINRYRNRDWKQEPEIKLHSVKSRDLSLSVWDIIGFPWFARCRYHLDARSYCLDPLVCSGHSIDTLIGLVVRADKERNHSHRISSPRSSL